MDFGSLISGLAAGLASAFLLHPLDLIKTRTQVDEGTQNKSIFHRSRRIYFTSGIRGFYRGVVPSCIGTYMLDKYTKVSKLRPLRFCRIYS
mmetsp:Transcript_18772/g.22907  ORF Transcript_18772/g.22907 Transcript_18772/m.22907 type:complete len:91 (+) Transcript_18772:354-626(+)